MCLYQYNNVLKNNDVPKKQVFRPYITFKVISLKQINIKLIHKKNMITVVKEVKRSCSQIKVQRKELRV